MENIEHNLVVEIQKVLVNKKKQYSEHISQTILERDEYARLVGCIQAYEEILNEFESLHTAFFPSV